MSAYNYKHFCSILVIVSLLTSCFPQSSEYQSDVVMKIGGAVLTRSEWRKHLIMFVSKYQQKYHNLPQKDSIKVEQAKFVDYGYILAGAYENGYDTSSAVKNKVLAISKYMMCQREGPLAKFVYRLAEKNKNPAEEGIKNNGKIKFQLYFIKFKNRELMVRLLRNDTIFTNTKDYTAKLLKIKFFKGVEVIKTDLMMPSEKFLLFQDDILKLNDGETSHPLEDEYNGYVYIFHKIRTYTSGPGEILGAENDQHYIEYLKQEKLYRKTVNKYLSLAHYKVDTVLLRDFFKKISYGPNIIIEKSSVTNLLNKRVLSYRVDEGNKSLCLDNIIDYINNDIPLRIKLKTKEQLLDILKELIANDVGYAEAVRFSLTEEPDFRESRQNFKNLKTAEEFQKKVLFSGITIDEMDLVRYYEQHKSILKVPSSFTVSVFTFNDPIAARESLPHLMRRSSTNWVTKVDYSQIKGLKRYSLHLVIPYGSKCYDKSIIDQITKMPNMSYTNLFKKGDGFIIIKKEKSGSQRIQTYDEARLKILEQLIQNRKTIALDDYLKAAKKRFKLINYFSDQDYEIPVQFHN